MGWRVAGMYGAAQACRQWPPALVRVTRRARVGTPDAAPHAALFTHLISEGTPPPPPPCARPARPVPPPPPAPAGRGGPQRPAGEGR